MALLHPFVKRVGGGVVVSPEMGKWSPGCTAMSSESAGRPCALAAHCVEQQCRMAAPGTQCSHRKWMGLSELCCVLMAGEVLWARGLSLLQKIALQGVVSCASS